MNVLIVICVLWMIGLFIGDSACLDVCELVIDLLMFTWLLVRLVVCCLLALACICCFLRFVCLFIWLLYVIVARWVVCWCC